MRKDGFVMQQTFYDSQAFELPKNKKPFLVCDNAFDSFGINLPFSYIRFSDFQPNPLYEDALAGADLFNKNSCDFIIAIGGGSCIDTAKSIKHYSNTDAPLLAVPTTAGTGSEATHFAVMYKDGEKYSIHDDALLPEYVCLQPDFLKTLPIYQKKCTMLDALCQAVESWWSKKATAESITYSKAAISLIVNNMDRYLDNKDLGNMLFASNLAGRAINITSTTAPHAMGYKLTTHYGLPHGHAVALCLPKVWRYMNCFDDIAAAFGKRHCRDAVVFFEEMLDYLGIFAPQCVNPADLDLFADSVNMQRLQNNPVPLDRDTLRSLYQQVLEAAQ
jgi:alcohol dehydrogenase class IV